MIFEQEGHKRVCYGAGGRRYAIGYAIGQKRPWVVEHDDSRWPDLQEAEARVHEIEARINADA